MQCVTRKEDMSPDGRLRILMEDDGDMIVVVVPASDERVLYAARWRRQPPYAQGTGCAHGRDAAR